MGSEMCIRDRCTGVWNSRRRQCPHVPVPSTDVGVHYDHGVLFLYPQCDKHGRLSFGFRPVTIPLYAVPWWFFCSEFSGAKWLATLLATVATRRRTISWSFKPISRCPRRVMHPVTSLGIWEEEAAGAACCCRPALRRSSGSDGARG